MNRNNVIILAVMAGLLMGTGATALAVDKLKKISGEELAGVRIKWFETRQEYQVEGADGSIIPVAADEVESLDIAKPAEFDKAARAMAAKQYDVAIPILDDVATRYKRLDWDGKARELLAAAYFAKGDFKTAADKMGELIDNTPKNQLTEAQYVTYWTALMGAQRLAILKKSLSDAITGESKSLAALAVIKRGDLAKSEGRREDAVLDYLRCVILYEEVREAQPEALSKAADLLREMKHPREDDLRKKLMSQYPESVQARKLGGG